MFSLTVLIFIELAIILIFVKFFPLRIFLKSFIVKILKNNVFKPHIGA